jgi:hypothetical protein
MKKILLTILTVGIAASTAFSQTPLFELYEGDTNDSLLVKIDPQNDSGGNPPWLGEPVGVAYFSGQIADNNFSGGGELVYDLTYDTITLPGEGQLNGFSFNEAGVSVNDGFYIITEGLVFDPALGNTVIAPALRPVVKSNTYKGAPLVLDVHAEQSDFNESKDVLINFYLLLGEGKGDAYIEYWYRADFSSTWQKIAPQYLTDDGYTTSEGPTSKSGHHHNVWQAGAQLGNQVKTNNAQIRVSANYGVASGWSGNEPFSSYQSGDGGYSSPSGGGSGSGSGSDPSTTDSDGDGVMDAYDYAPYDSTIWNDPYQSGDSGYSSPGGN